MIYELEWDLLAFVKEQEYIEEPDEVVELAINAPQGQVRRQQWQDDPHR